MKPDVTNPCAGDTFGAFCNSVHAREGRSRTRDRQDRDY
jgi:hypothetical protein